MTSPGGLLFRYRLSLGIFILGLVLSGLTAFPLLTEMRLLARWLGVAAPEGYAHYHGLAHWIALVLYALEQTDARYPFLAYGTDWLAFGHLCIAVFFVRPWVKPLESEWVLRCGLVCCAGVIPLAFIAGPLRGIPLYWRLIDSSFGVFGAVPLGYALHLIGRMRRLAPAGAASSGRH